MSRYEMRIDQLGFPTEAAYDEAQAFSIGHESCIVKFFKVIQEPRLLRFVERQKEAGKQIRLITPFLPERHLDEMKTVLQRILAHPCFADSVVIVNDFGLLNYLHRMDGARRMCLGRGLMACFDYAPWARSIYENESPAIQRAVSQVSLYDDKKMDFFRRYQAAEAEVNLTEGSVDSLRALQKAGFQINIHRSSFLYGTQRSCYIRRRSPQQACSGRECEQAERLEPEQLWDSAGFYEIPEDTAFPTLYLRGNQICGRAQNIPCDWADGIIIRPEEYTGRDGS